MQNEELRLKELYSYNILDTEYDSDFNQLVELASLICGSEMSLISLIDKDRQWFKAMKGVFMQQTSRETSFCAHAILKDDVFVIEDATLDERFRNNPFVTGEPNIRFYAGAPIVSENGFKLGTVCIIDSHPRQLNQYQEEALQKLARQAAILMQFKKQNSLLQQLVIEQQELREKAEQASKAQQNFLSSMSHEIRTPLNGVIGMTDLLLASNPLPHQTECLETLKFATSNLLTVVNDILDYNKITTGNLLLEKTNFDLHHLLEKIQRSYELQAEDKGIVLKVMKSPQVPQWVVGDSMRLTQILNNLVGNAIKFTDKGSVTIKVNHTRQEKNSTSILFEIVDTGIGIEPAKHDLIFKEFIQANPGTSRQFGGTGLGLAITKKLLELQGGTIAVESVPGKGSCFYFELCFENGKAPEHINAANNWQQEQKLKGLTILIVEDNAVNRMVITRLLTNWGVAAEHAGNGFEALEKVKQRRFDLILMDLQMPEMDGITATKIIREENLYDGPIIALTADAFFNSDLDVQKMGFSDFVLKPFNQEGLYQKICNLVLQQKT